MLVRQKPGEPLCHASNEPHTNNNNNNNNSNHNSNNSNNSSSSNTPASSSSSPAYSSQSPGLDDSSRPSGKSNGSFSLLGGFIGLGGIRPEDVPLTRPVLAAARDYPGHIEMLFGSSLEVNAQGFYSLRLYDIFQRRWRRLVVDDFMPTFNSREGPHWLFSMALKASQDTYSLSDAEPFAWPSVACEDSDC
ncbi:unnamed protein product [Polarella glacialis]|uniref:Uncharacterized protein n=1 Tax=Polarella glacialis TaxID=89957 RepID=A0A813KAU2_POLGL|nr:unnamed protein product [Polarella glacialis]